MKDVLEFVRAALPWVAMGLSVAVLFARNAAHKEKEEQYGDYGMVTNS